jgi:hypothetical protein
MKAKVILFLLGILFLWGSVAAYGQHTYSFGYEIKESTKNINLAIAPALAFEARELAHFPLTIIETFACARAYARHRRILYVSPSTQKSARTCIVFRTLRN